MHENSKKGGSCCGLYRCVYRYSLYHSTSVRAPTGKYPHPPTGEILLPVVASGPSPISNSNKKMKRIKAQGIPRPYTTRKPVCVCVCVWTMVYSHGPQLRHTDLCCWYACVICACFFDWSGASDCRECSLSLMFWTRGLPLARDVIDAYSVEAGSLVLALQISRSRLQKTRLSRLKLEFTCRKCSWSNSAPFSSYWLPQRHLNC
jgi:hypothetical protein